MSAAGRFGRSMVFAAMAAGVAVFELEHKKHAVLASAAAKYGMPQGHLVAWGWAGITVVLGLVVFALSSRASRGRDQSQRSRSGGYYPAPVRSGRRGGRR
jgi:surface antigen